MSLKQKIQGLFGKNTQIVYHTMFTPENHKYKGYICDVEIRDLINKENTKRLTWSQAFKTKQDAEKDAAKRVINMYI